MGGSAMMGGMRFAKGHGTGNDFVILPDEQDKLVLTPQLVAALCDRRYGIGGDGVLRVVPRGDGWFMDYWNADGSLAEMCGNGVRVYARYLVESGLAPAGRIPLETRAGPVVAVVGEDGVTVDMGLPRVYAASAATVDGERYPGTAVDCGNPHLVCPVPELSTLDLSRPPLVDRLLFPDGVNVEFAVFEGTKATMRVFERGVGETLSCGTGACAVAAVLLGGGRGSVTVEVPGGRLEVTFDGSTSWLSGPAVIVARGEVSIA
jgi:diaminopimelate epimerase